MAVETPHAPNHGDLDALASRYVTLDDLPWVETPFPGVTIKVLMEDKKTGKLTALTRMEPGSELPMHEHTGLEQSFVLEGSLVDEAGTVTAGNYVWRPAGSIHKAHAPEGCVVLGFFESPNRFLD